MTEERALSVVPHFELTPAEARERMAEFVAYVKTQMVEGSDYGVIPGTGSKPTLLKPGAEKLCNLFGLTIEQTVTQRVERWEDPGLFVYEVETVLRSMRTGTVVAHGLGACNSKESRYRWRQGQRLCPNCGKDAIIKGRAEYSKGQKGYEQGGWLCFAKKGGCGAKFPDEAPSIVSQSVERIENPDLFDQVNTILKMAGKRSLVDAVLKATRASGLFTQDLEDGPQDGVVDGEIVPSEVRVAVEKPVGQEVDWLAHINAAMSEDALRTIWLELIKTVPAGRDRQRYATAVSERKALIDRELGLASDQGEV